MKLMDLRAAIRKPGNPTMVVDLGNGVPMTVAFQKTPLLEALGTAFNDERTAETGLSYDPETCALSVDGFVGEEKREFVKGEFTSEELGDWEDDGHGTPPAREPEMDDEDDDLL